MQIVSLKHAQIRTPLRIELREVREELTMEGHTMEEIVLFMARKNQEDPLRDYYLSGDHHAVVSSPRRA